MDYWERRLREESAGLDSLKYFDPQYMSLTKAHQIWRTAKDNPYEVAKAVIQAANL